MIRRATASIGRDEYDDPYIDWDDDPEGEWVTYRAHVEEIRACEERVRDEERGGAPVAAIELAGYSRGYAAALDAARDAVDALPKDDGDYCLVVHACDALAAIDALRGESNE